MRKHLTLIERRNRVRRLGTRIGRCINPRRGRHPKIIVSMTSYPARVATVHESIQSLLAQKTLPDKVILWLCESDFPNKEKDLPSSLLDMTWFDVEIKWVKDDLKPHKKYFWAFQEYPDDYVITVDDDLIYRNTMINELIAMHKRFPDAVIASRTHLITFNEDGSRKKYEDWDYEAPHYRPELVGVPSMRLFATTGAGTLFVPRLIPKETLNKQEILELCPTTDDIWLKIAEAKIGIPVVAATADQLLHYVPGTQGEEALCHVNTESGGNDVVLARILGYFDSQNAHFDFDTAVADVRLGAFTQ